MTSLTDELPDDADASPRPDQRPADGRPTSTSRRWVQLITAAVPAAVILVMGWHRRWMNEDAFINLRIVDQVMAGHGPVFNAGERVESYTSTLWLAVLVLVRVTLGTFVSMPWATVIVTLACAVAAFWLGARTSCRRVAADRLAFPIGLAAISAVPVVWDFATSGLEMAAVWLWIAGCWTVLVATARRAEPLRGWSRAGVLVLLGLGPIVRPDLGLMSVCFVGGWLLLTRPGWRRLLLDLVVAFGLTVLYQIFRMGYFATIVPMTALAKDAGGLHAGQGWRYLLDLSRPYHLWFPMLVLAVILIRSMSQSTRRENLPVLTLVVAAVVHATYMVLIGGDYMHGRLLLPALFAIVLPVTISWSADDAAPARAFAAAALALALVWGIACAGWARYHTTRGLQVAQIDDWRQLAPHPLVDPEEADEPWLDGAEINAAYQRGERGSVELLGTRVIPNGRHDLTAVIGSIGLAGWKAGTHVRVIDIGGLAEPLAARTDPIPGRPAGHRKQIDSAWYAARWNIVYTLPTTKPTTLDVIAARKALQCAPIRNMLDGITKPLTPGRFLSNIAHSVDYTKLRIPSDPKVAVRELCP